MRAGALVSAVGGGMHPDEYEPENWEKFDRALMSIGTAETPKELSQILMLHLLDGSYSRRDLLVAHGRVAEARGWR